MTARRTRLLLWRHGRTAFNFEGRFQGQLDVPLDDVGRAQAAASADRLAALRPVRIVASDLARVSESAAAVAARTGLAVAYDVRLRERAFGEWQGLTAVEVSRRWPDAYARFRAGEPVEGFGIESVDDVAKRMYEVLHDLVAESSGATVVVATHGSATKRAIGAVLGWPDPAMRALAPLRNCHWSELRHDATRGWELFSHNVAVDDAAEPVGAR